MMMKFLRAPSTSIAAVLPPVSGGSVRTAIVAGGARPAMVATLRSMTART